MMGDVRASLKGSVVHRHQHHMPAHFTTAAYHRYPGVYKKRKPRRYRSRSGGQWKSYNPAPLVSSGHTRNQVMGTARFTASKQRGTHIVTARSTFNVPPYLKFIKSRGYDPSKELAATNRQEKGAMLRVFRDGLQRRINDRRTGKRRITL